jgi:hypothetical protein
MFHSYGIFNTHTLIAYQYMVPMGLPLNAVRHDILVRSNTSNKPSAIGTKHLDLTKP